MQGRCPEGSSRDSKRNEKKYLDIESLSTHTQNFPLAASQATSPEMMSHHPLYHLPGGIEFITTNFTQRCPEMMALLRHPEDSI